MCHLAVKMLLKARHINLATLRTQSGVLRTTAFLGIMGWPLCDTVDCRHTALIQSSNIVQQNCTMMHDQAWPASTACTLSLSLEDMNAVQDGYPPAQPHALGQAARSTASSFCHSIPTGDASATWSPVICPSPPRASGCQRPAASARSVRHALPAHPPPLRGAYPAAYACA